MMATGGYFRRSFSCLVVVLLVLMFFFNFFKAKMIRLWPRRRITRHFWGMTAEKSDTKTRRHFIAAKRVKHVAYMSVHVRMYRYVWACGRVGVCTCVWVGGMPSDGCGTCNVFTFDCSNRDYDAIKWIRTLIMCWTHEWRIKTVQLKRYTKRGQRCLSNCLRWTKGATPCPNKNRNTLIPTVSRRVLKKRTQINTEQTDRGQFWSPHLWLRWDLWALDMRWATPLQR